MITRGGVPLTRLKRPLVSEAIDQESFTPPGALMLFTVPRCRYRPGACFRLRCHPPLSQVDRVVLTEAEPRAAVPARPGLPAQRRDVRWARGRVSSRCHQGLRYVNETTELLAARAPKLRVAVRAAKKAGWALVVLDGALIPVGRVAADRPTKAARTRKSRTAGRTSPNRRRKQTGPTPGSAHQANARTPSLRQTRLADHGDHCYLCSGRARQREGGTHERTGMGTPLWGHGRAIGRPGAPFTSTPERHDHAIHF
jgi:hypothetical protein